LQAGRTFAAKIVAQALAIGGLRKHSRQGVFADAARSGEKQGAGSAFPFEHAPKRRHKPLIAEKFRKSHIQVSTAGR
jgi:hypothetical protein